MKMNEKSLSEMLVEAGKLDLDSWNVVSDVNTRWDLFKTYICNLIEKFAPLRKINERKNKTLKTKINFIEQNQTKYEDTC